MRMANYTDEKEKMLHDFVIGNAETIKKLSDCITAAKAISDLQDEKLTVHTDAITKLLERTDNQLELITKLSAVVESLNEMVKLVSRGAEYNDN